MKRLKQTIVAAATPPGRGGISIVRLSGPLARQIGQSLFKPSKAKNLAPWRLAHGFCTELDGRVLDEVLAVYMPAPKTYTGEDIFEIHCHGGPVVVSRLIELCQQAGASLARPGEFTLRAFLAGRIDLAQAEAVAELVQARHQTAARLAAGHLAGALSKPCQKAAQTILEILAELEAEVDFPEEDLEPSSRPQLVERLEEIIAELDGLIGQAKAGECLREGARVVLAGRPNVGKSSLLNALLARPRALVTEIPGTTRDFLEEVLDLDGLPVLLTDTAGLRQVGPGPESQIEAAGMAATRQMIGLAELVILVLDASQGFSLEDEALATAQPPDRLLVVANKADLVSRKEADRVAAAFPGAAGLAVSAKTGLGLSQLKAAIRSRLIGPGPEPRELTCLPSARQTQALAGAKKALEAAALGLKDGLAPEAAAVDLREGLEQIGLITGQAAPDRLLEEIFNRFCIGK